MGENSKIEWTDHTFNVAIGCVKVSPGCASCYAETQAKNRMGLNVWGPAATTTRKKMSADYWRKPIRWNKLARERYEQTGERTRVFCSSMADWAEDHPVLAEERPRLFDMIAKTPHLDWLLLTKRAENVGPMLPSEWIALPQPNVWLGFSAENQLWFDQRWTDLQWLRRVPYVTFVSAEPLIDQLSLPDSFLELGPRGWVIVGGESGPGQKGAGPRPMLVEWAMHLKTQCVGAGVNYFLKQLGGHPDKRSGDSALLAGQLWREIPRSR